MYITAGDISRNGTKIILRSYNGKYVFEKNMCHKITWLFIKKFLFDHQGISKLSFFQILIKVVRVWNRDASGGQTVENALTENGGKELEICPEYQGESIAIKYDSTGFYTTTELDKKNDPDKSAPIHYYEFSNTEKTLGSFYLALCCLLLHGIFHLYLTKTPGYV